MQTYINLTAALAQHCTSWVTGLPGYLTLEEPGSCSKGVQKKIYSSDLCFQYPPFWYLRGSFQFASLGSRNQNPRWLPVA